MAWKEIYMPNSVHRVAKVPSNSIYYNDPNILINLYDSIKSGTPNNGLNFGNGYMYYTNTGDYESLNIQLDSLIKDIPELCTDVSMEIVLKHIKKIKMFEYYVKPNMRSWHAMNTVISMISCSKESRKTIYVSEVINDLYGFIHKLAVETQEAMFKYYKGFKNNVLEFDIEYAEELEEIKSLVESAGCRFVILDDQNYGKELCIIKDSKPSRHDSEIKFVTIPYGILWYDGDFEYICKLLGYEPAIIDKPSVGFENAKEMFNFIRKVFKLYVETRNHMDAVIPELNKHVIQL
jgi:hypothetical protein